MMSVLNLLGGKMLSKHHKWSTICYRVKFLSKVDTVGDATSSIPSQFPELFQGLGAMKYEIKNAKLYALFSAHRIPIPLRNKVEQKLKQMEATEVISKIDQPTNWCAVQAW